MNPRAGLTPANQSKTSSTPAGNTNGGIEWQIRAARAWMTRHDVAMSQSKLSRLLRGFDPARHGRDEHALSRWLEVRCFDPTGETATFRADRRRVVA